jgi:hypothetical protein
VSRPKGTAPAAAPPAPAEAATDTAVTIVGPFQTNLAGQVYGPGDTVTVPAATAAAWQVNGWAVPAQ